MLAAGSKSFALAGLLLPRGVREDAAVLYAYCRRADDLIDDVGPADGRLALARLREELAQIYAGCPQDDALLSAFQELVARVMIPEDYVVALLDGMEMDLSGVRYQAAGDLDLYAYRVAGVVGLMMCHVLGVKDERCLPRAVHMGMAMQLTNVCRDVAEDWTRGRLYLPAQDLSAQVAVAPEVGTSAPPELAPVFARGVRALLARADRLYLSGERGLVDLGWRTALAIRVARFVYADIGRVIAARAYDVLEGRAVVSGRRKLVLVARALLATLLDLPRRLARGILSPKTRLRTPLARLTYPDDIRLP
jgi:phytoene synthase